MKKSLLFISTLLAAGTLSAWADTTETTLLNVDFTKWYNTTTSTGTLGEGWTNVGHNNSQAANIKADGLVSNNWGRHSVYTTLSGDSIDLSVDSKVYTISYTFSFSGDNNDFAAVLALASDDYTLAFGNSYKNNTGFYVGTTSDNVLTSSSYYALKTDSNVTSGITDNQETLADSYFTSTGTWTVTATLATNATGYDSLLISVSKSGGETTTFSSYLFDSSETLSTVGFLLDAKTDKLSVSSLSITSKDVAVASTISSDSTWTKNSLAETTWTNATAASPSDANITLNGGSATTTLAVSGTGDDIVVTRNLTVDGTGTLTISGDELTIISGGAVTAETGTTLNITNKLKFENGGKIGGDGTISLAGSTVTVSAGTLTTTAAIATTATAIQVDKSAMLDLGTFDSNQSLTLSGLTGTGTVEFGMTSNYDNNTFSVPNFTGTVNVTAGAFTLGASSLGNASLTLGGTTNFQLTAGTTVSVAGDLTFSGTSHQFHLNSSGGTSYLNLSGKLTVESGATAIKKGGGEFKLTGDVDVAGTLEVDDGTVTFASTTGKTATISGKLHTTNGTINIGNGTAQTLLSVESLEMGDIASNYATSSELNVKANATLKITGTNNTLFASQVYYKVASLVLGEWGIKTTANIEGTLLAQGANLCFGDLGADITVSGTLAVAGLGQTHSNKVSSGKPSFTLASGGKLILGENGIAGTQKTNFTISLGAGTVGMSASTTSITKAMTLTASDEGAGTTFDTKLYSFAADGNSIAQAADATGGTMTVSAAISGSGNLIKAGAGTLVLGAENTYTGATTVSAGTLQVGNAKAISTSSSVTVATGAELSLATDASVKAITSTGTISAASGTDSAKLTITGDSSISGTVDSAIAIDVASGTTTVSGTGIAGAVTVDAGATLSLAAATTLSSLTSAGLISSSSGSQTTLTLTGDSSISGDIASGTTVAVSSGTTTISGQHSSGTGGIITVAGGATLNISAGTTTKAAVTFSASDAKFTIDLTDAVVDESGIISIIASEASITYALSAIDVDTFFDSTNSELAGYDLSNYDWIVTTKSISLKAIPEPSMFGLLAGTLALALAGTRRRRKS